MWNEWLKQEHSFLFFRILFWTDWDANFPRIESASMSGAGRKTIYKDMKTGAWPNGLTVDHFEKRIVWTDARFRKWFFLYFLLPSSDNVYKIKIVLMCMYHVYTHWHQWWFLFVFLMMAFFNVSTNQIQAHKICFMQIFCHLSK